MVFPLVETPSINGVLAFRHHRQGYTPLPNWPTFILFASHSTMTAVPKTK